MTITDTQRLDWLIKQGPPGACEGLGLNETIWEAASDFVSDDTESSTDKLCVRAAIDAAMTDNQL